MRPKNAVPSYLHHKATGQARVVIGGKTYYLGPYKSAKSRAEYARLIAEWSGSHATIAPAAPSAASRQEGLYIAELVPAYLAHAESYYVKNGEQTSQVAIVRMALRPVRQIYGHTLARDFGPVALEACRQKLVDQTLHENEDGKKTRPLSRSTINKLVDVIRLMFRWAASRQMIPGSVAQDLACLPGLRKGRSKAKESAPVRPVPDDMVHRSVSHMPEAVAAMVRIQALTGCRPGEIVIMRGCDLNTSGRIWEYRPGSFKTEHREDTRRRVVYIGPQAQEVLKPWLKADLDAYLFNPSESFATFNAERRDGRKTPLYPSHQARYEREKKARGRRSHRDHYTVTSYRQAIERACDKAGVPVFKPNQIRHSLATRLRREFGLETAAAVLGHEELETSQIYAEKDAKAAMQAMELIG